MQAKPSILSFILCRDLIIDASGQAALHRPTHEAFGAGFPLLTEVSVYSTMRGIRGSYRLGCQLMNPDGEVVWSHVERNVLVGDDPLVVHRIILWLKMLVHSPGLYDFILTANDEEIWRTLFNVVHRPKQAD